MLEGFVRYHILAPAAHETVLVEWLLVEHNPLAIGEGVPAFQAADGEALRVALLAVHVGAVRNESARSYDLVAVVAGEAVDMVHFILRPDKEKFDF